MIAPPLLSSVEGRVLGGLLEKQRTTPQQYPLTLNAVIAACNQATARDPVVHFEEPTVEAALEQLKARRLVRFVLPSHGRSAVRYRHVLDEFLGLDASQTAVLAVLVLRGPQTVGEVRSRSERMATFDDLTQVEHELSLLADQEEPLVTRLPRQPGQKEERWRQLLAEPVAGPEAEPPAPPPRDGNGARTETSVLSHAPSSPSSGGQSPEPSRDALHAEVEHLRRDVATLRAELDGVRGELDDLRRSLGG